MSTMTAFSRGAAAVCAAGLMTLGLAAAASADHIDPPSGEDANQAENWVDYVEAHDFENVTCAKPPLAEAGWDGDTWVSDGDYALVVLKYSTVNEEFWLVEEDEELVTESGQDISHIITCTGEEPEEPTPTPTPTPTTSTPTPSGPIVETDIVEPSSTTPAILGGAAALAGLGLAGAAAMRRKGQH